MEERRRNELDIAFDFDDIFQEGIKFSVCGGMMCTRVYDWSIHG